MLIFVVERNYSKKSWRPSSHLLIKVRLFVRASWWYNLSQRYHGEPGPRIKADDIRESNEKGHGANQHSDHPIRSYHPLLIQLFNHHHPLSLLCRGEGEKRSDNSLTPRTTTGGVIPNIVCWMCYHMDILYVGSESTSWLTSAIYFILFLYVQLLGMHKKIMTKVCSL